MSMEVTERRLQWIHQSDRAILFIDLKDASAADSLLVLEGLPGVLASSAENSVLALADVSGSAYDPSVSARWKSAHLAFKPKVRAVAVYGFSGIVGVSLRGFLDMFRLMGMVRFGQELRLFSTRDDALAWLTKV
jgi:hypothetical protein